MPATPKLNERSRNGHIGNKSSNVIVLGWLVFVPLQELSGDQVLYSFLQQLRRRLEEMQLGHNLAY